jgi:hypothetical protein
MNELAKKIAIFINHNDIDTSKHTMEEIINGYFESQDKMFKEIEGELLISL